MPVPYVLKNTPIDKNRIAKTIKKFLDNIELDREIAMDTFEFFKLKVESNENDGQSKQLMVDCIKVASTAQNNGVKLLSLLVDIEAKSKTGSGKSTYDDLDDED